MGDHDVCSKPLYGPVAHAKTYQMIKIYVPDLEIHNCLNFSLDQLIWNVKLKCVASLPKELKDSVNYGLLHPPENGKTANFLDEHLQLCDYTSDTIGYLELIYKRRIYKKMALDEKLLKSIHTRVNFRRLIKYVVTGKVQKIAKMCSKGLDPNFHCPDSGETPLTLATANDKPDKALAALVTGGAFLDYRAIDGSTALHRAVENKSLDAVKALLKLGASPNCKDAKELTPLHLSVTCVVDARTTRRELQKLSTIDDKHTPMHELRNACKTRLCQLFDHLCLYGADINALNASGDTPLHLCAQNGERAFAEKLLAWGCERKVFNATHHTPYDIAITAGNSELAELILNYSPANVKTTDSVALNNTELASEAQPKFNQTTNCLPEICVAQGSKLPMTTAATRDRVVKRSETITKPTATCNSSVCENRKVQKQHESSKSALQSKESIGQVMFGRDVSKKLPLTGRLVFHVPNIAKKHRVPNP